MTIDKSQHNATVHGKIANQYADEYFVDTADYPFFEKFIEHLSTGARLLDVACGPGMFTKYFLEHGFRAEGVDLSQEMLAIARRRVPEAQFTAMDMRKLQFEDETFDGLLVAYALIFIPSDEVELVLTELNRVLKSNGKILIVCQEGESDHEESEPMKSDETLYVNFFSTARLKKYLEAANFRVISQDRTSGGDDPFGTSSGLIYTIAEKRNV